jgi:hypothetical protein
MIYTTLNTLRAWNPCADGWQKLLTNLNKTESDDEPLALVRILELNGLADAIWTLRTLDCEREPRLFAVACAREVQHLMTDPRSVAALDVADRFANDQASLDEIRTARATAHDIAVNAGTVEDNAPAWAAVWATWGAVGGASGESARAAVDVAAAQEKQAELFREIFS